MPLEAICCHGVRPQEIVVALQRESARLDGATHRKRVNCPHLAPYLL